jgi:hypothetical protein
MVMGHPKKVEMTLPIKDRANNRFIETAINERKKSSCDKADQEQNKRSIYENAGQ